MPHIGRIRIKSRFAGIRIEITGNYSSLIQIELLFLTITMWSMLCNSFWDYSIPSYNIWTPTLHQLAGTAGLGGPTLLWESMRACIWPSNISCISSSSSADTEVFKASAIFLISAERYGLQQYTMDKSLVPIQIDTYHNFYLLVYVVNHFWTMISIHNLYQVGYRDENKFIQHWSDLSQIKNHPGMRPIQEEKVLYCIVKIKHKAI